jgi:precorrin-3B synthase
MNRPAAQGWCPGAYRPMTSGDGLIVRVRPALARLTLAQALGLCTLAQRHGSGAIDLTSRTNLQLRGVRASEHDALLSALGSLGLLDANPLLEGRRNLLVAPFWQAGDATECLATELAARLVELPELPSKFGFAVDAGPAPLLSAASADIRIERAASGRLLVRADGAAAGQGVTPALAVDAVIALAEWFVVSGGRASGRMAKHLLSLQAQQPSHPPAHSSAAFERPAPAAVCLPAPGPTALGTIIGVAFGQIEAASLAGLLVRSGAVALRLLPGRLLLLEGAHCSDSDSNSLRSDAAAAGFLTTANDPLLRVDACPGAPACASATVATRALARQLAPWLAAAGSARGFTGSTVPSLHIAGCAKGCARAAPATLTLVGRDGLFDLVCGGHAWDAPTVTGLPPHQVLAALRAHFHHCPGLV